MYVAWRQYREEIQVVHFIAANDIFGYAGKSDGKNCSFQPLQMSNYIKIIYELLFDLEIIS